MEKEQENDENEREDLCTNLRAIESDLNREREIKTDSDAVSLVSTYGDKMLDKLQNRIKSTA